MGKYGRDRANDGRREVVFVVIDESGQAGSERQHNATVARLHELYGDAVRNAGADMSVAFTDDIGQVGVFSDRNTVALPLVQMTDKQGQNLKGSALLDQIVAATGANGERIVTDVKENIRTGGVWVPGGTHIPGIAFSSVTNATTGRDRPNAIAAQANLNGHEFGHGFGLANVHSTRGTSIMKSMVVGRDADGMVNRGNDDLSRRLNGRKPLGFSDPEKRQIRSAASGMLKRAAREHAK